jgi:hypothetical protein
MRAGRSAAATSGVVKITCADVEVARLEVELQRRLDARRIHYEQKSKRMRIESWVLKQRAELLECEADEVDRLVERKMKEGMFDEDSDSEFELSESEATVMVCDDDDDEERGSKQSESEQQTWALVYQRQGVALQR